MKLYRGINFGGYLSQCEHTLEHYATFITKEDVKKVKDLGFDHIRLPIDYEVLETKEGYEYTEGIAYVNQFLLWCEEYEMDVVLDLHKAYGYDFQVVVLAKGCSTEAAERNYRARVARQCHPHRLHDACATILEV